MSRAGPCASFDRLTSSTSTSPERPSVRAAAPGVVFRDRAHVFFGHLRGDRRHHAQRIVFADAALPEIIMSRWVIVAGVLPRVVGDGRRVAVPRAHDSSRRPDCLFRQNRPRRAARPIAGDCGRPRDHRTERRVGPRRSRPHRLHFPLGEAARDSDSSRRSDDPPRRSRQSCLYMYHPDCPQGAERRASRHRALPHRGRSCRPCPRRPPPLPLATRRPVPKVVVVVALDTGRLKRARFIGEVGLQFPVPGCRYGPAPQRRRVDPDGGEVAATKCGRRDVGAFAELSFTQASIRGSGFLEVVGLHVLEASSTRGPIGGPVGCRQGFCGERQAQHEHVVVDTIAVAVATSVFARGVGPDHRAAVLWGRLVRDDRIVDPSPARFHVEWHAPRGSTTGRSLECLLPARRRPAPARSRESRTSSGGADRRRRTFHVGSEVEEFPGDRRRAGASNTPGRCM